MRFRVLNRDPLYDVKEANKITQGIDLAVMTAGWKEPKDEVEYWIRQIVANHSTIRSVRFRLVDSRPRSVVMQVIRATKGHPQPEVESSRPDWTGRERSLNPYEDKLFMQDHTAESFVEMAKQRLCTRTEERTRTFMREMVEELKGSSEPFLQAVGWCCHPYCWWYRACPETHGCGERESLSESIIEARRKEKFFPRALDKIN